MNSIGGSQDSRFVTPQAFANAPIHQPKSADEIKSPMMRASKVTHPDSLQNLLGRVALGALKLMPIGYIGVKLTEFLITHLQEGESPLTNEIKKANLLGALMISLKELQNSETFSVDTLQSAITDKIGNLTKEFISMISQTLEATSFGRIQIAEGDEQAARSGLKGRGGYPLITKSFVNSAGQEYGNETVTRVAAVTQREISLEAKLVFLENKMNSAKTDESKAFVQRQIYRSTEQLQACQESGKTWVGSNDSREVLAGNHFMEDRKKMLPVAVNYRIQDVTTTSPDGDKGTSLHRYGVVWYPKNGVISMKDLLDLDQGFEACRKNPQEREAFNRKINEMISHFQKMGRQYDSKDQREVLKECVEIAEAFRPENTNDAKRREILEERANFLRDCNLEPVVEKFKGKLSRDVSNLIPGPNNSYVFRSMHVCLLNEYAKDDFHETGWAHFEGKQIEDMYASYQDLDGQSIRIHDGKGCFFDEQEDGSAILYLSAEEIGWNGDIPAEIKHEACFMNVSVQGNTTNKGLQAEINNKEFEKLEKWVDTDPQISEGDKIVLRQELSKVKSRLEDNHESSFELATELSVLGSLVSEMSTGCLSCKDRGGTIAELFAIRLMERAWALSAHGDPAALRLLDKAIQKFANEILDKDSPCVLVINDSTGVEAAKISVHLLSGMSPEVRVKKLGEMALLFASGGFEVKQESKAPLA
ncbi:MAG: hypothetical protein ACXWM7_01510 [Parachlamydiaceae bacterium]